MKYIVLTTCFLALYGCASCASDKNEFSIAPKDKEMILNIARKEVEKREANFQSTSFYLELYSKVSENWVVLAWAPYPGNTLGDFRCITITSSNSVVEYKNGSLERKHFFGKSVPKCN
jgi:hypothetical protein